MVGHAAIEIIHEHNQRLIVKLHHWIILINKQSEIIRHELHRVCRRIGILFVEQPGDEIIHWRRCLVY